MLGRLDSSAELGCAGREQKHGLMVHLSQSILENLEMELENYPKEDFLCRYMWGRLLVAKAKNYHELGRRGEAIESARQGIDYYKGVLYRLEVGIATKEGDLDFLGMYLRAAWALVAGYSIQIMNSNDETDKNGLRENTVAALQAPLFYAYPPRDCANLCKAISELLGDMGEHEKAGFFKQQYRSALMISKLD